MVSNVCNNHILYQFEPSPSIDIPGIYVYDMGFLCLHLPVILFLDDWGPSTISYIKDKVELYRTINNIISNCEYKIISIATLSEPTST